MNRVGEVVYALILRSRNSTGKEVIPMAKKAVARKSVAKKAKAAPARKRGRPTKRK
jgi:hypothetical protein